MSKSKDYSLQKTFLPACDCAWAYFHFLSGLANTHADTKKIEGFVQIFWRNMESKGVIVDVFNPSFLAGFTLKPAEFSTMNENISIIFSMVNTMGIVTGLVSNIHVMHKNFLNIKKAPESSGAGIFYLQTKLPRIRRA